MNMPEQAKPTSQEGGMDWGEAGIAEVDRREELNRPASVTDQHGTSTMHVPPLLPPAHDGSQHLSNTSAHIIPLVSTG